MQASGDSARAKAFLVKQIYAKKYVIFHNLGQQNPGSPTILLHQSFPWRKTTDSIDLLLLF